MSKPITGSCCCGKIAYTAKAVEPLWYCHCQQCRKITGHYMAAAQVNLSNIEIEGEPKWHYVSALSRHGFCADCGSQVFWRNDNNDFLSITGGSIDGASNLKVAGHVFVGEKGDYYEISGDEKRYICWGSSIQHS
jgi:hypothetical protein